jgi:hypothetical protein
MGSKKTEFCEIPVDKISVDHSDRNRYIKHLIKFEIDDSILEPVIKKILKKYERLTYYVGESSSCVNLSVYAAKWVWIENPAPTQYDSR